MNLAALKTVWGWFLWAMNLPGVAVGIVVCLALAVVVLFVLYKILALAFNAFARRPVT